MSTNETVISEFDCTRLQEVLDTIREQSGIRDWSRGDRLQAILKNSRKSSPVDVPADVVTMNSIVRVRDLASKQEGIYNLVFPSDSKPTEGRISVLSTLGLSLFGSRVGDTVDWETSKTRRSLEITDIIYQPEAARHWTL